MDSTNMTHLVWFREDLRISDHAALYHASKQTEAGVVALYIITPDTWRSHDVAACRVDFWLRGLKALQNDLAKLNIPLYLLSLNTLDDIPSALIHLCKHWHITAVHAHHRYEINEKRCDTKVEEALASIQVTWHSYHDQTILPPDTVKTQQETWYTVFTPYKKAWMKILSYHGVPALLPCPSTQQLLKLTIPSALSMSVDIPSNLSGWISQIDPTYWPAGEAAAKSRLQIFLQHKAKQYQKNRDYPDLNGTSQLSPYLATGMLSARQALHALLADNQGFVDSGDVGLLTWLNELIWREFYKMILVAFPRVGMHKPFKLSTERLQWHKNHEHLIKWQQGVTGYPIVDAAMRQLREMGWMHNRCRMITAMFFTKNLWLDWRLGEKWFMQSLVDGDLALNNGGWQWSASTGNDAAPYFRIFNPLLQSQKFDPKGDYIRRYCPELAGFDAKAIHAPYQFQPDLAKRVGYPEPIVDYAATRQYALAAFKVLG